jgi:glycosidase
MISPLSRESNHFNPEHPLYRFIARLHEIRSQHVALRVGRTVVLADDAKGPGLFAYGRCQGDQWVVVILNTAVKPRRLALERSPLPAGVQLQPLLGEAKVLRSGANGKIARVLVPPGAAWVFVEK